MAKRNVGREIAVSLGVAVLLGSGLGWYIIHSIPSREELMKSGPKPSDSLGQKGLGPMDAARGVVSRFAAELSSGRYEGAYALMAQPYRETVPLADFSAKCKSSRFLAGAQSAALTTTRRVAVPGSSATTYTFQGRARW